MSKPVNATKHFNSYYRGSVRHRGYGRRVLYPPRPRPGRPATAYQLLAFEPYEIAGVAFDLPKFGLYFYNSNDLSKFNAVATADDPWNAFNFGIWFYPCPDASDWQYVGDPNHWNRMTTPIPFGIQMTFSWT